MIVSKNLRYKILRLNFFVGFGNIQVKCMLLIALTTTQSLQTTRESFDLQLHIPAAGTLRDRIGTDSVHVLKIRQYSTRYILRNQHNHFLCFVMPPRSIGSHAGFKHRTPHVVLVLWCSP